MAGEAQWRLADGNGYGSDEVPHGRDHLKEEEGNEES